MKEHSPPIFGKFVHAKTDIYSFDIGSEIRRIRRYFTALDLNAHPTSISKLKINPLSTPIDYGNQSRLLLQTPLSSATIDNDIDSEREGGGRSDDISITTIKVTTHVKGVDQ